MLYIYIYFFYKLVDLSKTSVYYPIQNFSPALLLNIIFFSISDYFVVILATCLYLLNIWNPSMVVELFSIIFLISDNKFWRYLRFLLVLKVCCWKSFVGLYRVSSIYCIFLTSHYILFIHNLCPYYTSMMEILHISRYCICRLRWTVVLQ